MYTSRDNTVDTVHACAIKELRIMFIMNIHL